MAEEYSFFNEEGRDITYRVVTAPIRIAPIIARKTRDCGKKEERLVGFYILNGEQRDDAVEVPVNMQLSRSGLDFHIMHRLDWMNCEFVNSEVREI